MSTTTTPSTPTMPMIARTLRAAVKLGDNYWTVEETITLPTNATDEEIAVTVATGLRIYEAQRIAVEEQVCVLRDQLPPPLATMREPDAPASEKQRTYMEYLLREIGWDTNRLNAFAAERNLNVLTLTKREASELIDLLKHVKAGAPIEVVAPQQALVATQPARQRQTVGESATQRQIRALERLIEERGIDVDAELHERFGDRNLADLSMDEAGQLLSEWQQRPRRVRA